MTETHVSAVLVPQHIEHTFNFHLFFKDSRWNLWY